MDYNILIAFSLIILIFYLLIIRPMNKRARQGTQGAKKGNIIGGILGIASRVSNKDATDTYGFLLGPGENVELAYKLVRDYIIFTKKRLIKIDVQGLTGKKKEMLSLPYKSIVAFSVETAGHIDLDAELKIWVSGSMPAAELSFGRGVNIYEIQAILADVVTNNDPKFIVKDSNNETLPSLSEDGESNLQNNVSETTGQIKGNEKIVKDIEVPKNNIWICGKCGNRNDIYLEKCQKCGKDFDGNMK